MSETVHAVYARIVGTIDVLSRVRSGSSSEEGSHRRMAIDRAQALLHGALRELSESFAHEDDGAHAPGRLMGSAMVSPAAASKVDLTFTAFLAEAPAGMSTPMPAIASLRAARPLPRSGERHSANVSA